MSGVRPISDLRLLISVINCAYDSYDCYDFNDLNACNGFNDLPFTAYRLLFTIWGHFITQVLGGLNS